MIKKIDAPDSKAFDKIVFNAIAEYPGDRRPEYLIMSVKLFSSLCKAGYLFWSKLDPTDKPPNAKGVTIIRTYDLDDKTLIFS